MMKRILKPRYLVWLALPLLLLWALQDIPLRDIWAILGQLSLRSILILILVNLAIMLLFSSRWWLILSAQGYRVPYFLLASYRLASFGITYFTPGTQFGGEPLQVYSLRDRHNIPGISALASVTLDKLLELLVNFLFLVVAVFASLESGLFGRSLSIQTLLVVTGLLVLPLGHLLVLWRGKTPLTWLANIVINHLAARLGRYSGTIHKFRQVVAGAEAQVAFFCQKKPGSVLVALAISLLVWAAMLAEYWLMLRILGLRLGLSQTAGVMLAARLALLLPVPAGLGALEAGQVLAMQALGVNPAMGIGISLLIRARDLTFAVFGLWWASVLSRPGRVSPLPSKGLVE